MRTILILFLSILFLNANHISWLGDYNKALQKAKEENRQIMALLVKKNCKSCNEVIKDFFINRKYVNKLNKKFVSVILTYDSQSNYPIELFYSTTFPTLFFIDSKNETFLQEPIYDFKSITFDNKSQILSKCE